MKVSAGVDFLIRFVFFSIPFFVELSIELASHILIVYTSVCRGLYTYY